MSTYEQLNATVEQIIDAAIESHMFNDDWEGDVHSGFRKQHLMGLGTSAELRATPPGSPRSAGGKVTAPELPPKYTETAPWDDDIGESVYGHYESAVRELFENWDQLPDPDAFAGKAEAMAEAAYEIAVTGSGKETEDLNIGNPELESMRFLTDKLVQMQSTIINTFNELYAYRLPAVAQGQYELMALGTCLLIGEQRIWRGARRDITGIADLGLTAMKAARTEGGGGIDLKAIISTVGALVNIAAVFPTPAKPLLAGAGSILGSLGELVGDTSEPNKPEIPLGAATPADCMTKIDEAIRRLNTAIIDSEVEIDTKAAKALDTVAERSGSFDLDDPAVATAPPAAIAVEIVHHEEDLRSISGTTLPGLAQCFIDSAAGVPGAKQINDWRRPGFIGLIPHGPYISWAELVTTAEQRMSETAAELLGAATALQAAVGDVKQADEDAESRMRSRERQLQGQLDWTPAGDETYGGGSPSIPPYAE